MNAFWLILVHWLHLLSGIAWVGAYIFAVFVIWPAILRRPATEARAFFTTVDGPIRKFMATTAQLTFWLGLLRGTWLGPIRSFGDLVRSGYGHLFMTAILLTLAAVVVSARTSRGYEARVWDGDAFRPGAAQSIWRSHLVVLALMAGVLICMVLMRFHA